MATPVFKQGQTVRLAGIFTDATGSPVDPTTVTVTVHDPTGQASTPAVLRDSIGVYHTDLTADPADNDVLWRWKMEGTGAHAQLEFGAFKVTPKPF